MSCVIVFYHLLFSCFISRTHTSNTWIRSVYIIPMWCFVTTLSLTGVKDNLLGTTSHIGNFGFYWNVKIYVSCSVNHKDRCYNIIYHQYHHLYFICKKNDFKKSQFLTCQTKEKWDFLRYFPRRKFWLLLECKNLG